MSEVTVIAEWTPDPHRDDYIRLFLALLEAQKHICLNECSAIGDSHTVACMYADKALLEADAVLEKWEAK